MTTRAKTLRAGCMLTGVLLLSLTSMASAAVPFTNGSFNQITGASFAFGHSQSVPEWGEASYNTSPTTGFQDVLVRPETNSLGLSGYSPGFINSGGYLYQEIGTPDSFQQLVVRGENYHQNWNGPLRVEAISLDSGHSFAFAEVGNDIKGVGNLLGTHIAAPSTNGILTSLPFQATFDLTGLSSDSRLFVRFSGIERSNGTSPAFFDNVSAELQNSAQVVPEPSSFYCFGLCALLLLAGRRRRRRNS